MKLLFASILAATVACGTSTSVVDALRIRAANDFNCPQRDLTVDAAGGSSYRAAGCGQVGTYACEDHGSDEVVCQRK